MARKRRTGSQKSAKPITYFLYFFTLIAGFLLLMANMAAFINPIYWWPVALAGLLYPVWLVLNFLLIAYWLIKRNRIFLFTLCCLVLSAWKIPAYIGIKGLFSSDSDLPTNHFRVMTWNVRSFQANKPNKREIRSEMLKIIRQVQPDIICLQEYYNWTNTKENIDDSIKLALHTNHYFFKPLTQSYNGMAIFSKLPIVNTGFIQISEASSSNQCIFADIIKDGKILRVYTVHLCSINLPEKSEGSKTPKGLAASLTRYLVITKKLKNAFVARSLQVNQLKTAMALSPYPYILAGDFNDTPSSYAFHQLSAGLKNSFSERGKGYGITHWEDYPSVQIDYILAKPVFKILTYHTISRKLSDHYPIYTDIDWQ